MPAILLLFLGMPFSLYSATANYELGSMMTVREFANGNDYLSVATELPLDAIVSFDPGQVVGPQRYQNSEGEVRLSRGDWVRGLRVISLPEGESSSDLEGKTLYFSFSHLVDMHKVGEPEPGFGDSEMGRICEKISRSSALSESRIGVDSRHGITRYYTPVFPNLTDQHEGRSYRYWCLNFEGSCIVGDTLWNYPNRSYDRSQILCQYGFGNGRNQYNKTNCLNPCTTIAADQRRNKAGTVVYIPRMKGKICPHTGEPVSGCFVVGDVGSAIKGKGRFDLFTGVCQDYEAGVCKDEFQAGFRVSTGARFFKLNRSHPLAKKLREANDRQVRGPGF